MRREDEKALLLISWALIFAGFYVLFQDMFTGLVAIFIGFVLNKNLRHFISSKFNRPARTSTSSATRKRTVRFNFSKGKELIEKIKNAFRRNKK